MRGEHHHHEVKSESDRERVWVSLDSEGNELGYHVEPVASRAIWPEEWLIDPGSPPTTTGPVRVNHRLFRQTLISLASGMAGAGIIEALIHH